MGDANPLGGIGADQRIGNTMNATNRLDLIGRSFRGTAASTAVPDPTRIAFVMPYNLGKVGIKIQPHTTNDNGQTSIKIVGRQNIGSVTNSTFIDSENHVFKGCFTRQLPATDGDDVVLAHFLRVRSPKSSSFG